MVKVFFLIQEFTLYPTKCTGFDSKDCLLPSTWKVLCLNVRELCPFVMFYGLFECIRKHDRLNMHYVTPPAGV